MPVLVSMSASAFHETVLHARRWTGDDAKAAGIVQESLPVRVMLVYVLSSVYG